MTTALAAAAIVPAVVATPAQAAEAEVTFAKAYYTTANGTAAFAAGNLAGVISATGDTGITHLEASNGEVFTMQAFSAYLAVNPTATTDEVLTALSKAGKALSADQVKALNVKEGKVENNKVTVDADAPVADVKVESVKAINKTTVEVKFNTAVDSVKAENFTIEGASVTAATLDADKKKVTLTVSGLSYETKYTVEAKNIEVDGEATDFGKAEFTTPAVNSLWDLQIVPTESSLMADGADNTVVKFKLINKETGKVDLDADNIVLDLNTTYGTLASKRVTVQDGEASVLLTSEFSNTNIEAKIDAQIIEASGDYKELIGKVVGTASVAFVTSVTENVETVTLVNAEANQADRVTLFFDKNVSIKHFVKTNAADEILYNVRTGGTWGTTELTAKQIDKTVKPEDIRHVLKLSNSAVIKQAGNSNFDIQGVKPVAGNSKAVEIILEKGTHDNNGNYSNVLTDNANVDVEVNTVNSLGKETKSTADFKVTDARNPEATSVKVEGLNVLKVKFSEAIADATFQIDGRFGAPNAFTYEFGHFNPVTLEDNRDLATITLKDGTGGSLSSTSGYDEDGITDTDPNNKTLAGYFTAGNHTVQISSTKDFAWKTDKNNIGQTQNLNFTVAADTALPAATVVVESPEQFRFKFDKTVVANVTSKKFKDLLGKVSASGANEGIQLQVLNTTTGEYEAVATSGTGVTFDYNNDFEVTRVSGSEYVVELKRDWTTIYDTADTNKNYYNDKYRFVVAKGAVTNASNGLKNEVINLDLNYSGSVMNTPDVTSPVIDKIERVTAISDNFHVTMSEPVKLMLSKPTTPNTTEDNAGNTLAPDQSQLAPTTAQFIGKDKDGKTVTINANVKGYADVDAADKVIEIDWTSVTKTPQEYVDEGGSEDWTLVVRAITDDVGNTAASATKDFKIVKSPATDSPFFVDYTGSANSKSYKVVGKGNGTNADTVEITFSEGVQVSGASDATNPAQYTLNGKTLPAGTSIKVADDSTATHPTTEGFEKVIISLPDGTLNAGSGVSNVITVNKNLISYDGSKLQGDTEITFTVPTGVAGSSAQTQSGAAHNSGGTPATQGVYTVAFTGTGSSAANDKFVIDGETLTIVTGGDKDATASELATHATANANLAAKYTFDGTTTAGTLTITQKAGQESTTAPTTSATITDSTLTAGAIGTTTSGAVEIPNTTGGDKQVETLTVTTPADAKGNVVVEFTDGTNIVSKVINVVAGDTQAMIAAKIETAFATGLTGWTAAASGSTVVFTADNEAANNTAVKVTIK